MCNYCDKKIHNERRTELDENLAKAKMADIQETDTGLWYNCPVCHSTGVLLNRKWQATLDYAKINRIEKKKEAPTKLVYDRFGNPEMVVN